MFSDNNSSISEYKIRLNVCNNERDMDENWRRIAEYYINSTMTLSSFANISRIKKFKDLCDEDIVGRHFSITNFIKVVYFFSQKQHTITYIFRTLSNFNMYVLPIFIILGLLGNCLSVIVLSRKKMRSLSSNIYLGVLAICDIIYSMKLLIEWLFITIESIEAKESYAYLVLFVNFLTFFSQFMSVWLVVAFTIERYIVTKYPLLRRSWCTVKRAKIIIITLMGLAILHCILKIFIIGSLHNELINKKEKSFFDAYKRLQSHTKKGIPLKRRIVDSIIIFTLPALVIVTCNTLIGYHIYQQNRLRKTLVTASDSSNERTQISSDKMLQNKITKMLVFVSSIFVILKLPNHYFLFFFTHVSTSANISYVFVVFIIFSLLDTAHYSINFILYCVMGQNFRRELIRIFKKRTNIKRNKNIMEMDNYK